jgi:hypothetical protein
MKKALPKKSVTAINGLAFGTRAVEADADEERTDQRLHPDQLGDDRRRREADEQEHVPQGPLLTEPGEEPPGDPGNDDEAVDGEHDEPDCDVDHQTGPARVAGLGADDQCEHHERDAVGDRAGSDDGGDGSGLREAELGHRRVGDQRERRPERADQHGGTQVDVQEQRRTGAECHRNERRQQTEPAGDHAVADEGIDVELQTGEEDQVEDTDTADGLQALEPGEHVEHVGTDDGTEHQQSQQAGQPQAFGDERPEHDDQTDDREAEGGPRLHLRPAHPKRPIKRAAAGSHTTT